MIVRLIKIENTYHILLILRRYFFRLIGLFRPSHLIPSKFLVLSLSLQFPFSRFFGRVCVCVCAILYCNTDSSVLYSKSIALPSLWYTLYFIRIPNQGKEFQCRYWFECDESVSEKYCKYLHKYRQYICSRSTLSSIPRIVFLGHNHVSDLFRNVPLFS